MAGFSSQVVSEVKAKKMETMKGIKRLQVQKDNLAKKQKQAKADYDKVKAKKRIMPADTSLQLFIRNVCRCCCGFGCSC